MEPNDSKVCPKCQASTYPLHRASATGHLKCLKLLLKTVQKVETVRDAHGNSLVHAAAVHGQTEALDYLLQHTALSPKLKNLNGSTCAHLCAQQGRLECLKIVLGGALKECQAIALERDNLGCTCLHGAVLINDNDCALWLLRRFGSAIANCPSTDGVLPLHIAAAQGNIEFIQIATKYDVTMVNGRDRNGSVPTFYAVQAGHLDCVRYLVEKARADLGATTNRGQGLVHGACLGGHLHIAVWLLARMQRNAVYWPTVDLATPFHCAAYGGHVEVLNFLYKLSGNNKKFLLNAVDRRGNTVLHLAALKNRLAVVQFLLSLAPNLSLRNGADKTALEIAQARRHRELIVLLTNAASKKKGRRLFRRAKSTSTVIPSSGYGSAESRHSSDAQLETHRNFSASPVGAEPSSGYGSASSDNVQHFLSHSPNQRLKSKIHSHESFSQDTNWLLVRPHSQATYESIAASVQRNESALSDGAYDWLPRTRRSVFLDSACQTDEDSLDDNVILTGESPSDLPKTTVIEAVVHQSASPVPSGPALSPPILYDPERVAPKSKQLRSKSMSLGNINSPEGSERSGSKLFRSLTVLNEYPSENESNSMDKQRESEEKVLRYFGSSKVDLSDGQMQKNPQFQSLQDVAKNNKVARTRKSDPSQVTCQYLVI